MRHLKPSNLENHNFSISRTMGRSRSSAFAECLSDFSKAWHVLSFFSCPFIPRAFAMPICRAVRSLEGQDRQSPIASNFGSQTQALFAVLTCRTVELGIANRAF